MTLRLPTTPGPMAPVPPGPRKLVDDWLKFEEHQRRVAANTLRRYVGAANDLVDAATAAGVTDLTKLMAARPSLSIERDIVGPSVEEAIPSMALKRSNSRLSWPMP